MGRGLSDLQQDILKVLAQKREAGRFVVTGEIIDALGLTRNPGTYASVSRALGRLCARGEAALYQPSVARQGKGFGYGLPPTP